MTAMLDKVCREIIEKLLLIPAPTRQDLNRIKIETSGKHKIDRIPTNSAILKNAKSSELPKLIEVLKRKTVRSISGVTVIATMTKPYPCPKDSPCAYCPGGPPYNVPQSYTGFEPATMRGIQHGFDPYEQVKNRVEQLLAIGHIVDKAEIIIMGGTFPSTPIEYQEFFVKGCLDALNGYVSSSLQETKKAAETGKIRNVGITVETRPDWAKQQHINRLLSLGVTRVELGVQNVYDDIYELVGRGHTVKEVIEATRLLKDSGLKVAYHLMPKLPGSNFERDLEGFKRVFYDKDFKPDMIKIYPCLVLKGTKAYEWWLKGEYQPYTTEEAANLIVEVKKMIPPWVRIMRVQRDIPAHLIAAGVNNSNLREIVHEKMVRAGLKCNCIRCREVGQKMLKENILPDPDKIELLQREYDASEGKEIFLSIEDSENGILIGYLRLRIPSEKAFRPEIKNQNTSIIRELHVYGPLVPVGKRFAEAWQHKGYGGILLCEAERISKKVYGCRKTTVISALGTKRYYMQFGYNYDGVYMSKLLED
jgi:elongator complex protein 3